jgi:shikimate dehydrogenase
MFDGCGFWLRCKCRVGVSRHGKPPVDALPSHALVADVIMDPHTTALPEASHARGLKVHHGKNMMNYAMPIAASFFDFPAFFDWNGNVL